MFSRNKYFTSIMVDCNKDKLIQLAVRFRAAIMKSDPEILIVTLRNFPRGACGDATLLLAKYLEENECNNFEYICGKKEQQTHAWLERNGFIIDITADQFNNQNRPVFVSMDHSWHLQFEIQSRRIADFTRLYDQQTINSLWYSYKQIMKTMSSHAEQSHSADK